MMTRPGSPRPPTITCCVFAWDEVGTLRTVVESQILELGRLGVPYELLVIDDGSTDGTAEEADRLACEHRDIRVIHHIDNRGLGGVYRTGFEQARGLYVTFFPADGQFPASLHHRLYPLMESWDLVLGNLPGRNDKLLGAMLGRIERVLYWAAFGEVPRLEGVFMCRRELLSRLQLRSQGRGWTIVWELVLRAQRAGYRIVGCPITLQPRTHGVSKVNNLRNVAANVRQLFALRRLLDQ
jgi:glycosyltransferase involved in cell wall biosynthesis